jgi:sulfatase modifying factor 1
MSQGWRLSRRRWRPLGVSAVAVVVCVACECGSDTSPGTGEDAAFPAPEARVEPLAAPRALYLPDAASFGTPAAGLPSTHAPAFTLDSRCPPEMVDVRADFCIDRYEAVLLDANSGQRLSPYYHPTRGQTIASLRSWQERALSIGSPEARALPVPAPPEWQLEGAIAAMAHVERGAVPNGYLNRTVASAACEAAGKRLCTSEEWVTACKGHRGTRFPYGDSYVEGRCNVFRNLHPARVLHGNASEGHLDPRLNQVREDDDPLLRVTGGTPECRSEWGADAVYDMVGNLDEWVSDAGGVFVGGFFSRATRQGCEARIESHPPEYFDYSLGVRCCR